MTATVQRRTRWDGFTSFGRLRLCPPAVSRPGIRCDGGAGPMGQLADVTIQPGPHDHPQRGHENIDLGVRGTSPAATWAPIGRRPEDDLRKAPNAQRIYAGLVRTVRDHSAEQHSVESRG